MISIDTNLKKDCQNRHNNIDIKKIVKDNIMSPDEIVNFISGNIPYDYKKIRKIILIRNYFDLREIRLLYPKSIIIDTSRRKLFFDEETESFIIPTNEGSSKAFQYLLQVKILNFIKEVNIQFEEIILRNDRILWKKWLKTLNSNLKKHSIDDLDGIIVGSINNIYFRFCQYFKHLVLGNLDTCFKETLSSAEFGDYLIYRLDLILMEDDLIKKNCRFDKKIFLDFQITPLPSMQDIILVKKERSKVDNYHQRINDLLKNNILVNYIKADYLYSRDRQDSNHSFDKSFVSSDFIIIRDPLIEYQIIKTEKGTLINLNWVSSDLISMAIKILNKNFKINNFYNFGKCGYLGQDCIVGDLVKPIASKHYPDNKDEIIFDNLINTGFVTRTLTVDSPLVETINDLREEAEKNEYTSIEMELSSIINILKPDQKKYICYYISDTPLTNINLSIKLDLLMPRLKCLEIIFGQIVKDYIVR